MSNYEIPVLVGQVAEYLLRHQQKLAVAESCTGGWVAKVLTDLAGSSEWFERGFVTYSNQAKCEMLGVSETTLNTFGAVSQETVCEMALGTLNNSHTDFSLSVSGIAGPDGGSEDKPVGLVWFAWAKEENKEPIIIASEHQIFKGDREAVRQQAVEYVIAKLIALLDEKPWLSD